MARDVLFVCLSNDIAAEVTRIIDGIQMHEPVSEAAMLLQPDPIDAYPLNDTKNIEGPFAEKMEIRCFASWMDASAADGSVIFFTSEPGRYWHGETDR